VSDNWEKAYSELKDYIAKNPQIEISMDVIAIPGDVRPEFYRLFDMVRVAFLKEKCQTLLDEAIPLSSNYAQAAKEVTKSLRLSEIKVPPNLNWFLNDPVNGLIRSFYNSLFNLLKGKIDINTFECEATESFESSFRQLFHSGYEKWVVLSLVNLFAPDKALAVPIDEVKESCHEPEPDEKIGFFEKQLPDLKEMEILFLRRDIKEDAFILSNLIVRSAKLGRYVSIGTDLTDATWTAKQVSGKREWYQIRELGRQYVPIYNWPDLVVYVDDQPEDISLVADFSRFCRPDIIVECMEQVDWYQKGGLDKVRQNYDFLKPRLGSYVVSRLPMPEEAHKELMPEPTAGEPLAEGEQVSEEAVAEQLAPGSAPEKVSGMPVSEQVPQKPEKQPLDIHILTVGFNQSKLEPIINALIPRDNVGPLPLVSDE